MIIAHCFGCCSLTPSLSRVVEPRDAGVGGTFNVLAPTSPSLVFYGSCLLHSIVRREREREYKLCTLLL